MEASSNAAINIISNSKKKTTSEIRRDDPKEEFDRVRLKHFDSATGREGRINNNIKKLLKQRKILLILLKVVLTHHKRRC